MEFDSDKQTLLSGIVVKQEIETNEIEELVVKEEIEMNMENNEEAGSSDILVKKETDEAAVSDSNLTDNEDVEENVEKFYQCGACMATFADYDDLKKHVEQVRKNKNNTTHPPVLTSFNCLKCEKSFCDIYRLNSHMIIHTGEKTHECSQCPKRFLRSCQLKQHMITHLDVKPIRCEVCRKRFSHAGAIKVHMRTHTGEKPHKCHICHLCFSDPANLRTHILTHVDGMNFKCEICPGEKLFKTKHYLAIHMRIHKKEKIHKCFKCDKKFLRKFHRTAHERTHLNIKPYECEHCKKRFVQSSHLTSHIRTHTGEKPYKCELCGQGFSRLSNAKKHLEREKSKEIERRCDYKSDEQ